MANLFIRKIFTLSRSKHANWNKRTLSEILFSSLSKENNLKWLKWTWYFFHSKIKPRWKPRKSSLCSSFQLTGLLIVPALTEFPRSLISRKWLDFRLLCWRCCLQRDHGARPRVPRPPLFFSLQRQTDAGGKCKSWLPLLLQSDLLRVIRDFV